MTDHRHDDSHKPDDQRVSELAAAFAAALLSGDELSAEAAVREAMDANLTTAEIDDMLIAPALWLVGELWEQGKISVAEEHIATEISMRVLTLQREAQRVARSRSKHRVLLATPTGEAHVVALRMVSNLLRGAGYDVVMVGADLPANALGTVARAFKAAVVCLSSTMPGRRDEVLSAIDEVRREWPSAAFVVGGRGLTVEGEMRPEVYVCQRVSDAVEAVDAMVKRPQWN